MDDEKRVGDLARLVRFELNELRDHMDRRFDEIERLCREIQRKAARPPDIDQTLVELKELTSRWSGESSS